MLLETYKLEIVNSECMPGAMGVHCFAHLDQDDHIFRRNNFALEPWLVKTDAFAL